MSVIQCIDLFHLTCVFVITSVFSWLLNSHYLNEKRKSIIKTVCSLTAQISLALLSSFYFTGLLAARSFLQQCLILSSEISYKQEHIFCCKFYLYLCGSKYYKIHLLSAFCICLPGFMFPQFIFRKRNETISMISGKLLGKWVSHITSCCQKLTLHHT